MLTIDQIAQPSYGIVNSYSTSPLFCQRNSSAARFEQKGDSSLRCRRPLESHDSQLELPPTRVKGQVKKPIPVTTLFVDVDGVLPPNGWDHHARKRAAKHSKLIGPRWTSVIVSSSKSTRSARSPLKNTWDGWCSLRNGHLREPVSGLLVCSITPYQRCLASLPNSRRSTTCRH